MWMNEVVNSNSSEIRHQRKDRLIVRSGGRVVFVPVDEIDWIEADANYVRVHLSGNLAHLSRQTIGKMTEQLDGSRFLRIHRSFIVNVNRIRELYPGNSGDFIVLLRNGKQLPCSRTYRRALQALYSEARREGENPLPVSS
jgi:two-component system LytT family response regulator